MLDDYQEPGTQALSISDQTIKTPGLKSIWDKDDPKSIIRMVGEATAEKILLAYETCPDLFSMDESLLYTALVSQGHKPTPTDNRLRLKFWIEMDYAQMNEERVIDMDRVSAGICSVDYFKFSYLKIPQKVSWLLCPPVNYTVKTEEALEFGVEQLRDILNEAHTNNGKVDVKLAELKLKIVAMLDSRVRGTPVQRTMNVHAHSLTQAPSRRGEGLVKYRSLQEIDKRLVELRQIELESLNGGINAGKEIEAIDGGDITLGEDESIAIERAPDPVLTGRSPDSNGT